MGLFHPATISKGSFAFCRITVASMLWLAVALRSVWLVGAVCILMLASAVLKVERAPLIVLYRLTVDRIRPSANTIVDQNGIFFSHVVGTVFGALCIFLLLAVSPVIGWIATAAFALLQTAAACGFCSALKLYTCMVSGNCCRFGSMVKKVKDHA